jgi:hypothetical protein
VQLPSYDCAHDHLTFILRDNRTSAIDAQAAREVAGQEDSRAAGRYPEWYHPNSGAILMAKGAGDFVMPPLRWRIILALIVTLIMAVVLVVPQFENIKNEASFQAPSSLAICLAVSK